MGQAAHRPSAPPLFPHPPEHLLSSSANMERLGEVSLWFPNIKTKVRQSHPSERLPSRGQTLLGLGCFSELFEAIN